MTLHIFGIFPDNLCHLEYDTNGILIFISIQGIHIRHSSLYMIIYLVYSNMKVLLAGVKYDIENMHYFQSHTISMILHAKEIIR